MVIAQHSEQLWMQTDIQQDMAAQHDEFQHALGHIIKSHDDQLAAQLATQQSMVDHNKEFQRAITDVVAGQVQSQHLLEQQLRLIRDQLEQLQTQGPGRGLNERAPLMLPSYEGTMDAGDHIGHYEAIGLTESWSDEENKTGFHRTLVDIAAICSKDYAPKSKLFERT